MLVFFPSRMKTLIAKMHFRVLIEGATMEGNAFALWETQRTHSWLSFPCMILVWVARRRRENQHLRVKLPFPNVRVREPPHNVNYAWAPPGRKAVKVHVSFLSRAQPHRNCCSRILRIASHWSSSLSQRNFIAGGNKKCLTFANLKNSTLLTAAHFTQKETDCFAISEFYQTFFLNSRNYKIWS